MKLILLFLTLCLVAAKAETIQRDMTGDVDGAFRVASRYAADCQWSGATVYLVPGTQSMWPTLDEGCFIVLVKKPWAEVKEGEIHGFDRKGRGFVKACSCLHRAVATLKGRKGTHVFILRGDNNSRPDEGTFGEADYLYTVYAIVRFKYIHYSPSITLPILKYRQNKLGVSPHAN